MKISKLKKEIGKYLNYFTSSECGDLIYQANRYTVAVASQIHNFIDMGWTGMKVDSILDTIGNTPCVLLNKYDTQGVNIYLKMETTNPGGSIKDRIAVAMLEQAEKRGDLKKGMTVIEPSSGNTAIGMAMVCASKGYKFIAILDRMVPASKRDKIKAYGADIIFLPDFDDGIDTVLYRIELTKKIIRLYPNSFSPMQFENEDNPQAHFNSTGREIYRQFENNLHGIFITAGSCGTITGTSRYIKRVNPDTKIFAVEPQGSVIFGGEPGKYFVQGAGLAFRPKILDETCIDNAVKISDLTAFKMARDVARKEGILLGGTGACALAAAFQHLHHFNAGDNVVVVIPDSGERYVDTIYNDTWLTEHHFSELVEESTCDDKLKGLVYELGCTFNEF
ncbi:PLP-dependent cysteine synthase family protein [Brenneria tiliae]|uniref:cysteine synthase n=1 Tax=Brenneria tiliae TaxID=2914984 RepID=A0ABT0MVR2_9GAMM|nr:cysteine synthase family protein [Brenneria tiliae]MCL2893933.1 cysteine synthase family protein [Brenneria tiliae]